MKLKLQHFHFKKSRYERPSAKKVCGLKAEGGGCELGPDQRGNCPGRAQCVPFRSGDRWECTRSQANGGKCGNGPSPGGQCPNSVHCVPVDTVRNVRRRVVGFAVLLMASAIAAVLYAPLGQSVISPGELSAKHGGVALNQCSDCHGEAVDHAQQWLGRAWKGFSVGHSSNANCLGCHKLGATAGLAHGVPSHMLADFATDNIEAYADRRQQQPAAAAADVPCFACHTEHRGADADLTAISNQQCDGCHLQQHHPFASHPEFISFSPAEKVRVEFDHQKHFVDYFRKDDTASLAKTRCDGCHELAADGRRMAVVSFEQACQSCHQKDVTGEKLDPSAVAFLALPLLDIDTLNKERVKIGAWPALAEARITPFMYHWLGQYPEIQPLLAKIQRGEIDPSYLADADAQDIRLVGVLAWRIKQMLAELETEGHPALIEDSETLARTRLTHDQRVGLLGTLPLPLVRSVNAAWFRNLQREVADYRRGVFAATSRIEVEVVNDPLDHAARLGGWYAADFTLFYQPLGHEDGFLRAWLEFAHAHRGEKDTQLDGVFSRLSERGTPGQCGKCHQSLHGDAAEFAWTRATDSGLRDALTGFDHSKHFQNVGDDGCVSCHRLDMSQASAHFSPIVNGDCQSCHTAQAAGQDCTVCHNYHLEKARVELPATLTRQFLPEAAPQ